MDNEETGGWKPIGSVVQLPTMRRAPPNPPPAPPPPASPAAKTIEPANDATTTATVEPTTGTGHFFAVDRRAWLRACELGLNAAVSYLVLAAGTGQDQRTTFWSVNAVEKYTAIARGRADTSVKLLIERGLIRLGDGTRKHPRYWIVPAHEIPGCEGYPPSALTDHLEKTVYAELPANGGAIYVNKPNRARADRLVRLGWATVDSDGYYRRVSYDAEAAANPDWIWLPKALVMGAVNETPPLELVRQRNDVCLLRLFVQLYGETSLADNGGIHWKRIRRMFTREKIGERGEYIIFAFGHGTEECFYNAPFLRHFLTGKEKVGSDGKARDTGWDDFWASWETLKNLGLVQMVAHLIESDTDDAEVIHPLPVPGDKAEQIEHDISRAATQAARAMLPDKLFERMQTPSPVAAVSVFRHQDKAQLVGIARLRYRPRNRDTSDWYARLKTEAPKWMATHQKRLEQARVTVAPASAAERRR